MDTLTNKDRALATASATRVMRRVLFVAGLAAPLILLAHGRIASDRVAKSAAEDRAEALLPAPSEIGPLAVALADTRYGLKLDDMFRYRRIFSAIEQSDWAKVARLESAVGDRRLIGHVMAARLLATDVKPSYAELRGWIDLYADLPEADSIYRLADSLRPPLETGTLPPPRAGTGPSDADFDSEATGTAEPKTAAGDRAASKFYSADDKGALTEALHAIATVGSRASTSRWIAGLAAWRLGQLEQAGLHFAQLAQSRTASGRMLAAGAYWAGRVDERRGASTSAAKWFKAASRYPTTFYGLLAMRKLGADIAQEISAASVTAEHLDILAETPAGFRAIALLEIGQHDLAARELEGIDPAGNPKIEEAIIVVSEAANLGKISAELAQRIAQPAGDATAKFPIPSWQPHGGFRIDPALVYAVARQESGFDPSAVSSAGATGLMQIMPSTANFLAPKNQKSLLDPSTNLDIGQRYLHTLMNDPNIGGNLLLLAVAYNRGAGDTGRFQRMLEHDDPLMAVESIRVGETHDFIEHVLANYWIYRSRLGADTSSLTDLANGRWPLYRWDNDDPAVLDVFKPGE